MLFTTAGTAAGFLHSRWLSGSRLMHGNHGNENDNPVVVPGTRQQYGTESFCITMDRRRDQITVSVIIIILDWKLIRNRIFLDCSQCASLLCTYCSWSPMQSDQEVFFFIIQTFVFCCDFISIMPLTNKCVPSRVCV